MRQVFGPGALGRPRGIGWRGRWEGGSGWGTLVNPWLIHVDVWQKPLQYCKVISLQLIKINGKKGSPQNGEKSPNNDLAASQGQILIVSVFKFPPCLISVQLNSITTTYNFNKICVSLETHGCDHRSS